MSTALPTAILIASVVVAAILAGVGVLRVVQPALRVKKRVDALKQQPILATLAATQARVATTQRNVATLAVLLRRAERAVAEIRAARERVAKIGRTITLVGRAALKVARVVRPTTDRQTPGS